MATRSINTKITLEGEKEYRDAIKNINSGIGVLNSELKKVTAEYKDNADSVESLTAKNDVLERKLSSQKDKVETLREALANAAKEYGESDKRTMSWQKQLNEAEAAVYNTESAIRENNKALEEAKKKTDETDMSVGELIESLGIKLPAGAEKALGGMTDFSVGSAAKIAIVVAAVKEVIDAVNALIDITQEAAGYVDNLATTSTTSGIDMYTLQVLSYMEDLADTNMSTVTNSMTKLTKAMGDAASGSESAAEKFNQLGISIETQDGHLRDATDVFWESIDALGKINNQTERDAVAMELFGRSARDLNVLIGIGSEGFKTYAREAENVGYILSEKDTKALNEYQDALDRAEKQQEAIHQQMAAKMAPALTELTEGWSNLKTEGLQLIIDSGIIDFLADVCDAIGVVIGFVGDMIGVVNDLLHPIRTIKELLGYENDELEKNAELTKEVSSTVDEANYSETNYAESTKYATSAIQEQRNSLIALNSQCETTSNGVKKLTAEATNLVKSLGGTVSVDGTYWFDEWGNRFSAEDDIESNYYEGYAQTVYEYIGEDGKVHEMIGEDSRAGSKYWEAHGYTGHNASGDYNFVGGWTALGENGSEMAYLPSGTRILTAQETRNTAESAVYVTVNVDHLEDVEQLKRIISEARQTARMR